jgi:mRNA interferase MazF
MKQEFDSWNNVKKKVEMDIKEQEKFPQEGEVRICFVGKNIGCEQNGGGDNFSRPVVVIKKFNNKMFWVVPLSTKQKKFDFYYNFDLNSKKISAILAQLKLMSIKRLERKMGNIEKENLLKIKSKLRGFL